MLATKNFYRWPKINLLIVLMISLLSLAYAYTHLTDDRGNLQLDTSLEAFFSDGDGAYDYFKAVESEFGNENMLFLVLEPQRFDLNFLLQLQEIQKQLKQDLPNFKESISILDLPRRQGVCAGKSHFHQSFAGGYCESILSAYQRRIVCLESVPQEGPDELDMLDTLDQAPGEAEALPSGSGCSAELTQLSKEHLILQTEIQVQAGLESLAHDQLVFGELMGRQGKSTALLVTLEAVDPRQRTDSLTALERMMDRWAAGGLALYLGGHPREEVESARTILANLQRLAPVSVLLLLGIIFLMYRSWAAVWGFLIVSLSGFSVISATLALFGTRPNVVTLVLPPLVITIGTSYIIHFFGQYFHSARHPEMDTRQLIDQTLRRVIPPLALAVGTTAVGFIALMTSPIPAVRDMGLHAALGTLAEGALTVFALPSLLLLFGRPPARGLEPQFWDIAFTRLGELINNHSRKIMWTWAALVLAALIAATQVKVDAKTSGLAPKSQVMLDKSFIESRFGGTSYLRLVLSNKDNTKPVASAQTINGIIRLKRWLDRWNQAHPKPAVQVERLYSPLEYIEADRQTLDGLEDLEVLIYLDRLNKNHGLRYLSRDKGQLALTLRLQQDSTEAFLTFRDQLSVEVNRCLPGLQVRFTGVPILVAESASKVSTSQLVSLGTAILVIAGLLSVMFFSLKVGVLILLPNLASVLIFFGALGALSLPMGVTLSLVAAISLGIGLDDSIHFILHFDRNLDELKQENLAMQKTLRSVGKPMVFTTIALVTGFVVLATSDLEGQVTFGLMTAFTLTSALLSSLLLLPALLARTRFVTLWDFLAVKYEQEFISSISLFQDMSPREFKLLTVIAETLDLEPGDQLFRENQNGDELFVLLEGQVEVYLDAGIHSGEKHITYMSKGAVFGEQVLFPGAKRMDSARAVEPSKLLAMDVKKLTSFKTQFPATAIKLFGNLAKNLTHSLSECHLDQHPGGIGVYSTTMATELERLERLLKKACAKEETPPSHRPIKSVADLKGRISGWFQLGPKPGVEPNGERFNLLAAQVIKTGEITYYQALLINEYLSRTPCLSAQCRYKAAQLFAGLEEGGINEARPVFANIFNNLKQTHWSWLRENMSFKPLPAGTVLVHRKLEFFDFSLSNYPAFRLGLFDFLRNPFATESFSSLSTLIDWARPANLSAGAI